MGVPNKQFTFFLTFPFFPTDINILLANKKGLKNTKSLIRQKKGKNKISWEIEMINSQSSTRHTKTLFSSHLNTALPQVVAVNRLFRLRPPHRHHFLHPLPLIRFIKFNLFLPTIIATKRLVPSAQIKQKHH